MLIKTHILIAGQRCAALLRRARPVFSSAIAHRTEPCRARPRRSRCGLSLFEALLVILIAVPMAQQGVRLAQHYIRQQAGVQESRLLTQVVTAASTYALRNLNAWITDRGDSSIEILPMSQLANDGAWVGNGGVRTALGRDIQVIFYDTGSGALVVLARAVTPAGERPPSYVPRGGEGIGLVGTIREDAPNMLRGPGLDYPLDMLLAQATAQGTNPPVVVGDHLAIAVLRMDQNVLPYLHRDVVAGHPEANTMKTDLDMGGCKRGGKVRKCDLLNVGALTAETITVNESMGIKILRGDLEVKGNIKAGDLTISGKLEAKAIVVNGEPFTNGGGD